MPEIKIFVSCPGDVTPEKEQIKRLCRDFSDENRDNSNITFTVIDWKDFVGSYGVRPQEQLNEYFGDYDIYIGILWKRFGTKPGSENSDGKENESGTEEEFYIALDNYKTHRKPQITFFIKNYDREPKNKSETKQLLKVYDFVEKQIDSNINYINKFYSGDDFNSKIIRLLKKLENKADYNINVEEKNTLIGKETKIKIAEFKTEPTTLPQVYIKRSTSHLKLIKDKQTNPFLEIEQQSLDQLMISTRRVVLLGDAGSGKSTELRNLHFKLSQNNSPFVPILQNFNSYTPEIGLEAFLPNFWKEVPSDLLLIIWDGLDEIEPKNFNTVVRQINTFSEKYRKIKILISCRTNFYELPINNSTGTLPGFEPFLINDLNVNDAEDYFSRKYSSTNSYNFITEVFDSNLGDLITKPFFLMLLTDQFNQEDRLQISRAELYEMFLLNRIELDQNHFKTSVDLRSKKQEIVLLLQKVALSMEILAKNQITESEILTLITSAEFKSLKYCTAFKKRDGEEDIWQFEHNNIQEFLAAKALSNLEFDKVLQFIAFDPNYDKLIPSWVNTLAFLFSILNVESDLFKKLLEWVLENEKEVIVKFEPDKIAENLRIQIFQGIFNYYKSHDVWISSNKFSAKELARFGQSELNLRFLIDEIKNGENTRTVCVNAIRLLGHFQIETDRLKGEIEILLLEQIDRNISDSNFIHNAIYALERAALKDARIIVKLMEKVGNQKNQYIRAAMYAILLESDVLEDYVGYLIEGYELIDKEKSGERDDVSLVDERWNLKKCIKGIKSPKGIKEIIEYISKNTMFEHGYDSKEVIEAIVANATVAYEEDNTVFEILLSWFKNEIRGFRQETPNLILQFFDQTNTREQAFQEVWESVEGVKERNKSLAIAKLITPELMQFVIDEYLHRNITNKDLEGIHFDMGWVKNENCDQFENLIHEKTGFKINKREQVNHEALNQKKQKHDFNLLFDPQAFKEATLKVFRLEQKDTLSYDELFEIRKENNRWVDIDEHYPNTVLRLLRALVNKRQTISKDEVIKWFDKDANEEWYRVSCIYDYLSNDKEFETNTSQRQWIANWCTANVSKVNFKEAIEVHDGGRVTVKTMAIYVWYLTIRCHVDHPKNIFLDMLSFDFFEDRDRTGIEYIISKLEHSDIINRMSENMREGIPDDSVLKNHIKYLCQNNAKESYQFILNEIINLKRSDYKRREFLELFFENTKDIEGIKSIIDQADADVKWAILDILKANSQELFVEKYILNILEQSEYEKERSKAIQMLVSLQNMQGLKAYVELIKKNIENNSETNLSVSLNSLKKIEAVPFLLELLELSYIKEMKVDMFDGLNSHVLGAFNNIALVSEQNFQHVRSKLQEFMANKSSVHSNVKYILHAIKRMEEQFYMNKAQSFTLKQVKEKLELF
jgi:hypothetical protein